MAAVATLRSSEKARWRVADWAVLHEGWMVKSTWAGFAADFCEKGDL